MSESESDYEERTDFSIEKSVSEWKATLTSNDKASLEKLSEEFKREPHAVVTRNGLECLVQQNLRDGFPYNSAVAEAHRAWSAKTEYERDEFNWASSTHYKEHVEM